VNAQSTHDLLLQIAVKPIVTDCRFERNDTEAFNHIFVINVSL